MTIIAIVFAAMFFSTARVYYAYNYDLASPTVFKTETFPVVNPAACPGEKLEIEVLIDKVKPYHGEFTWYFVGEDEDRFIRSSAGKADIGNDKLLVPSFKIPKDLDPGQYKVRMTVIYQLNEFVRSPEPIIKYSDPFLVRSDCE